MEADYMFCKNCGTDVTNMKFCPNCGTRVDTDNSQSSDIEAHSEQKKFTIQQAKWLSFSVVLTAWGLLLITSSLFPYIMCEILYDYSGYNSLEYIFMVLYFILSVFVCVKLHSLVKSTEYVKTPQYKLSKVLAMNKSNFLQMIILALFIWYAMVSKRSLSNGDLRSISIIVLVLCGVIWVRWIFLFKAIRQEDIKMIITIIYISIREFWISFALFIVIDVLLTLFYSVAVLGILLVALVFVYPAICFVQTKRTLEKVYHIK